MHAHYDGNACTVESFGIIATSPWEIFNAHSVATDSQVEELLIP